MKLVFSTRAWDDYLFWQQQDKKILRRLNELIRDCQRSPFAGLGKPEPLKGELSGWWSRRMTLEHRLVYRLQSDELQIAQCRLRYR